MLIICYIFISVLALWCLISTIALIRWIHGGHQIFAKTSEELNQNLFVGGILGLTFAFSTLFWLLLFFIPDSWGQVNEDGDFETTRRSLSLILGGISAFVFPAILEKWVKQKKNKK